ncbi:hypothetical protein [Leptolyngbya sp. O-77]|uniref:hypothetical protein n=1 Tax=Leptolyngbya sp. O-77 TaxID=1080068 RepID=UPI0008389F4B|nr:hypothetical protein [Leptolyngbya sp. O-77]
MTSACWQFPVASVLQTPEQALYNRQSKIQNRYKCDRPQVLTGRSPSQISLFTPLSLQAFLQTL